MLSSAAAVALGFSSFDGSAIAANPAVRRGWRADFHDAFVSGIVMPSLQRDDLPVFRQVFETGESLAGPVGMPSLGAPVGISCVASSIAAARLGSKVSGHKRAQSVFHNALRDSFAIDLKKIFHFNSMTCRDIYLSSACLSLNSSKKM